MALPQLVAGPVLPAVALLVVVDELQDRSQLLFVVLDRRAGQGPGAASWQLFEDVTGFVPVLDALGFVRDDKTPDPSAQLAVEVGSQALIPDEGHVGSCGPLPLPVGSRAPDDDGGEFGRPAGDLPTPLIQNTGWRDDQAGAQFAAGAQDPNRGDGLHRLAEPHVVGQQQAAVRHERAHPVPLERHQVAAPIQMLRVTPMCRRCPQDAPQAVRQRRRCPRDRIDPSRFAVAAFTIVRQWPPGVEPWPRAGLVAFGVREEADHGGKSRQCRQSANLGVVERLAQTLGGPLERLSRVGWRQDRLKQPSCAGFARRRRPYPDPGTVGCDVVGGVSAVGRSQQAERDADPCNRVKEGCRDFVGPSKEKRR